jgi:hypothetical protein
MFVHYLKFKMSSEFIDIIKELQNKLSLLNVVNDNNWMIHYSKSLTLFEAQSRGNMNKINTINDVNKLLDGFVENYYGIYPGIKINGLVFNFDHKGKCIICLKINSTIISDIRMNLAYYFNYINMTVDAMDVSEYNFVSDFNKNIIVKKFVNLNGNETIHTESIDIELPIISESHLKKNVSLERVYLELSDILYNYHNEIYYPVSLHFETENTRAKKISLW